MAANTFHYFAYGSNMLRQWLANRCPSSKVVGIASIADYELTFSKPSVDKSGKATLEPCDAGRVHGVLYVISLSDQESLDRAESGYDRRDVTVQTADQKVLQATTYFAKERDPKLMPYDWYAALIRAGAKQHGLPDDYLAKLDAIHSVRDAGHGNSARPTAIQALNDAGFIEIAKSCG